MTDFTLIKDTLDKFFRIQGTAHIQADGVVNVKGNVQFNGPQNKLPVKFGEVTGFFMAYRMVLNTLEGAPHTVGDNFDCSDNNLTSLAHAPQKVGKNFRCSANKLTSLAHAPTHVPGSFNCAKNQLHNLLHAPESVGGDFSCYDNPLHTLEGAPAHVGSRWWLTYDEHLPLLRTLGGTEINFMNMSDTTHTVEEILNKYMRQGKAGALKASLELIRAGFKDNARW